MDDDVTGSLAGLRRRELTENRSIATTLQISGSTMVVGDELADRAEVVLK